MSAPRITVSAAEVRQRLAGAARRERPSVERRALREAAALCDAFESAAFEGLASRSAIERFILDDAEVVTTPNGARWRLRPSVRTATIREMAARDHLAAPSPLPSDPTDRVRPIAEAIVAGTFGPARDLSADQLAGAIIACSWLGAAGQAHPDEVELRRHQARAQLIEPMAARAEGFVGRQAELDELVSHATTSSAPVPIVVHGPGGIGKSTLIAQLLVELAGRPSPVPCAYLTLDRIDLRPEEPLGLLDEAARQLGLLLPGHDIEVDRFRLAAKGVQGREVDLAGERELWASPNARRGLWGDDVTLVGRFARLIEEIGEDVPSVVLVLDAFEAAQRLGESVVQRLVGLLSGAAAEVARLVVIIAGRAEVDSAETVDIPLAALLPDEARRLVHLRLSDGEIDPAFVDAAVAKMGGNPLALRLLADLLDQEAADGGALDTAEGRTRLLGSLDQLAVQGILYARILDHLSSPDLRKLARPGLVVRFVTPQVIEHVLAGPCDLEPMDAARAVDLYERLSVELGLVERTAEALVHRADLRESMLAMLWVDDANGVEKVHHAAVAWYSQQQGELARTEELYHRLCLAQPARDIDQRWTGGASSGLARSYSELPPAGQAYLADRLGWTVDDDVLLAADGLTWARHASRLARSLLERGEPAAAVELLTEREEVGDGRGLVASLLIEALAQSHRLEEADDLVEATLVWADQEPQQALWAEVAVLGARIAEDQNDFDRAEGLLSRALARAEADDFVTLLTARVGLHRVRRRAGHGDDHQARLRGEIRLLAHELPDLERRPTLLRDVVAEVGSEDIELLQLATRVVGVASDALTAEARDMLSSASPGDDDPDDMTSFEVGSVAADLIATEAGVSDMATLDLVASDDDVEFVGWDDTDGEGAFDVTEVDTDGDGIVDSEVDAAYDDLSSEPSSAESFGPVADSVVEAFRSDSDSGKYL